MEQGLEKIGNRTLRELLRTEPPPYPWYNAGKLDRWSCEEQIASLYQTVGVKRPQIAWTKSPMSMFTAHHFMREFQTKTRQTMVEALIPFTDAIETDAKRAFMEAMLDRDRTVSVGASMKTLFRWDRHHQFDNLFRSIEALPSMHGQFQTSHKVSTPATIFDGMMFPGGYCNCIGPLGSSVYAIMPFVKLCWVCMAPLITRQHEAGFLHCGDGPAMEFADGFRVFAKHVEIEGDGIIDGEYLEVGEEPKELPAHEE